MKNNHSKTEFKVGSEGYWLGKKRPDQSERMRINMKKDKLLKKLKEYLIENYGYECEIFEKNCIVCQVWRVYWKLWNLINGFEEK